MFGGGPLIVILVVAAVMHSGYGQFANAQAVASAVATASASASGGSSSPVVVPAGSTYVHEYHYPAKGALLDVDILPIAPVEGVVGALLGK